MDFLEVVTAHNVKWFHSSKPLNITQREELSKHFGFLQHHVDSTEKGKTPRPKISTHKRYVYFVFHIPYKPHNSPRYAVCELNIFLTKNTLITIESQGNLQGLQAYFQRTKLNKRNVDRRLKHGAVNLFLNVLTYLTADIEALIDVQGEKVDAFNEIIFSSRKVTSIIKDISILRYNQIVAFTALERQSRLLESYTNHNNPLLAFQTGTNHKWQVFVETVQTLAYELNSDMEHLEGLVKTFETLVTNQTNETIKILTVFSVIMLPLTLLSGIYGMNFQFLPLSNHPFGFLFTLTLMVLIGVFMLVFFRIKKWL